MHVESCDGKNGGIVLAPGLGEPCTGTWVMISQEAGFLYQLLFVLDSADGYVSVLTLKLMNATCLSLQSDEIL